MAAAIYTLCALTSLACALLLLRGYARSKTSLLLWSGLCFVGLTANNALLVVDRVMLPLTDLSTLRLTVAFFALMLLLFGLIWGND
jgi:hypothetical protein